MSRIADDLAAAHQVVVDSRKLTEGRQHYWISGGPIFSPEQIAQLIALVEAENEPAQVEGDPSDSLRRISDQRGYGKLFWKVDCAGCDNQGFR